ncbi:MAG: plsB [Myxococcaceae bacterium]|nr:plsB [Myxococcaceae bacterium]
MSDRPIIKYEPNFALKWLYQRFFEHIQIDETWTRAVREADARGTVVYVLRNLSFVDFLALDHLTKRLELPQVRFANDLGLWVLEPMGRGWLQAIGRNARNDADDLRRVVTSGKSAALFLKRAPSLLEPAGVGKRAKTEGDVFIRTLFEVQRTTTRPILLVPQVFVWSKQPDAAETGIVDSVLGPREWPGKIRTVAQFLANYRHVTLRAGEPIDVKAFLEQESAPDDVLVRRITYSLLRRVERERRAVVGPTKKPADRLRDEVLRSPRLQKIIHDMAGEGEPERRVMSWRALSMLREMEADLDMTTIGAIDATVDQIFPHMYSALEVDEPSIDRLRDAMKDGTVILLPSHKSHIDYIVLAYVLYTRHLQLPLIAAGDNLNFLPLGPVLRRAGAFFIRRSFRGDRLYGAVVDAYMRRLIIDGWSLEFFLEGGRSRTGKLLPPKVGLLSLVVDAALSVRARTIRFLPVSIGYERVVEEASYVRELSGGDKPKEDVRGLLSTAGVLNGRYGRINVQFGELLTLEQVLRDIDASAAPDALSKVTPARRRAIVTRLAYRVMNEINRVTAITPGALVATALLTHDQRGLGPQDLLAACHRLAHMLHGFGARFSPSLADPSPTSVGKIRDRAIREACELFVRANHVEVRLPDAPSKALSGKARVVALRQNGDAFFVVPDEERLSLDLAKNIVVHFFVERALVATALLGARASTDREGLKERVLALSRLFKYEFQFRADATFERIFDETLAGMAKDQDITLAADGAVAIASDEARVRVVLYAQIVKNFVEGYRIAARSLAALSKGPLTPKELGKRGLATGDRMFLAGEIVKREAVSRPVLENAYGSFVDQGYLARNEGKLSLTESYVSSDAVRTIEAKISAFL